MKAGGEYLKDILDPKGPHPYTWNKIFLASCVLAVGTDPLFFYIPIIHDDKKCIATDDKLKIAALVMRCFSDIFYITDIYYQIRNKTAMANPTVVAPITRRLWPYFILTDILGVLPLTQVVFLFLFSKLRGPRTLDIRKFLDFLVFGQYVLRLVRTYLSTKELKRTIRAPGPVVKGVLNLFLYVTASHVLGAFWYYLSAQRQIGCWQNACRRHGGCVSASFDCNENTRANGTFLNDFCPTNPPNATVFDFGIFLDALQQGVLGPMDFPKKFLQCYWWGLRNLSSFGQNLKTSTFAWETWFAILVSVIGMLLFLYLIGNLQIYMELATTRSEEMRQNMKTKEQEINLWISNNNLPQNKTAAFKQQILNIMEPDKDIEVKKLRQFLPLDDLRVDVESLLSLLPLEHRTILKRDISFPMLKKVPILQNMEDEVLEHFISHLKPVVYSENSYIIRKGEPLDLMLFITQGVAWSFAANDDNGSNYGFTSFKHLKKGDYYGEELVNWTARLCEETSSEDSFSSFPISSLNVRSHTKVEALVLTANDLMAIVLTWTRSMHVRCFRSFHARACMRVTV